MEEKENMKNDYINFLHEKPYGNPLLCKLIQTCNLKSSFKDSTLHGWIMSLPAAVDY